MIDSTGKPIYVPECDNETVKALNMFIFESTIDVMSAISIGDITLTSHKLTLTNVYTNITYEISVEVKRKYA